MSKYPRAVPIEVSMKWNEGEDRPVNVTSLGAAIEHLAYYTGPRSLKKLTDLRQIELRLDSEFLRNCEAPKKDYIYGPDKPEQFVRVYRGFEKGQSVFGISFGRVPVEDPDPTQRIQKAISFFSDKLRDAAFHLDMFTRFAEVYKQVSEFHDLVAAGRKSNSAMEHIQYVMLEGRIFPGFGYQQL